MIRLLDRLAPLAVIAHAIADAGEWLLAAIAERVDHEVCRWPNDTHEREEA